MNLNLSALLLFVLFTLGAHAQNQYTVNGAVIDNDQSLKLKNASVSVLRSKDSILVKFTRVNPDGRFSIDKLPKGNFFLQVTYPGYADYVEDFSLDSVKSKNDFGNIKLTLKATLLSNVIIKGNAAAIKIKGDTTEFNAAAYTIQPNSKVEDLLKQLPGITVDKDGKITAQGQTVTKVLVDGEEFFGDDPTLVTKNLRGDMVDKVQLYDKKSDQAAFTGIDDGKKDKTINIKLKEDKKNGYFGKLDAGAATDKYYQVQGMFNAFKGKKKLSLYGTLANTGKVGLGWGDSEKYGSSQLQMSDEGYFFSNGGEDALDSFSGQYNDEGLPIARNGGAHYDAKWNDDKESINSNYKIGSLNVEGNKGSIVQNNLPSGTFISTSNENFDNYMFRQKLDGMYQIKIDTTSTLKISVDGTLKKSETKSIFNTQSVRGNDVLLNQSQRQLDNNTKDKIFNAAALWTKKFNKPRRTLSVNLSTSVTERESDGFLNSANSYYNTEGLLDSTAVIDQEKTGLVKATVFNSNVTYTEPLSKYFSLALNYGFGVNNSSANRGSFNRGTDGSYSILDTAFSNDYQLNQVANQGGAIINFKNNKTTFNFGTKVSNVTFDQKNLFTQTSLKRSFLNWRPQASYNYKISSQSSFNLNYNGSTVQPSIEQIQPLRINNDPLNIVLGNPTLKPSFRNSISVNYYSYKVLTSRNIYGYLSYNNTANPIVGNITTDSAGKTTFQSINLNKSSSSLNLYSSMSQKIKALGLSLGLDVNANQNISYNYINNQLNKSKSGSYGIALNFYKSKDKKYDFYGNLGPTYNTNESSVQKEINSNGWGINGYGGFTVQLPLKFEIGSNTEYQYQAKTKSFNTSFSRVIMGARISKKFLKSDGLKLTLSGNDLLNQNVGFRRSASGNTISQNTYTTIRRYFMGSISWDFSKMGGPTAKK
jgi:hypothetical protein